MVGVAGLLENAPVEGEPAEFPVEVSCFAERRFDGRDRRLDRRFWEALHQLVTPGEDWGFLVQSMSPN
jgi:hypothetical protein